MSTICGYDYLGAEVTPVKKPMSLGRGALALAAGALGALLIPKHPVLAFLGTAAAASNAHAAATGDRTWKQAIRRMGRHVVATVGSLSVPKYPAMGYVAGAVAADLFIDGEGHGIIEEWEQYVDVGGGKKIRRDNIIDAEIVEDNSKALVKVR